MGIDRSVLPASMRRADASPLGGLLDVLDRADGAALPRHQRAGRARTVRTAVRPVPVPAVRPRPLPARSPQLSAPEGPAPGPAGRSGPGPRGRVRAFTTRMARWGAGAEGEYLAWNRPVSTVPIFSAAGIWSSTAAPPVHRAAAGAAPVLPRRPVAPLPARGASLTAPAGVARPVPSCPPLAARARALVRRLALWGAGPEGERLAWGRTTGRVPRPDAPVVLTELPSTPTIRPAASSPAAALRPARASRPAGPPRVPVVPALPRQQPAPRPARTPGPVPADRLRVPPRPVAPPRPAGATRTPVPRPRGAARTPGPARTPGDARPPPARGSPTG